jgi:hypothetical protein
MPRASKWSKPDLAPEERKLKRFNQPPRHYPRETLDEKRRLLYFFPTKTSLRFGQLPKSPKLRRSAGVSKAHAEREPAAEIPSEARGSHWQN